MKRTSVGKKMPPGQVAQLQSTGTSLSQGHRGSGVRKEGSWNKMEAR